MSKSFQYLKEIIWKRIQGWREKILSMTGKEILINVVAQAIPTYVMACFDLTKSFCKQLRSMISWYWWGQQDKDKIHWLNWDILKQLKHAGVCASVTYMHSILLCWRSKGGGWSKTRTPYVLKSWKLSILPTVIFYKQGPMGEFLTPGEVFWKALNLWKRGWYGVLEMGRVWTFGMTLGSREAWPFNHAITEDNILFSELVISLIMRLVCGMKNMWGKPFSQMIFRPFLQFRCVRTLRIIMVGILIQEVSSVSNQPTKFKCTMKMLGRELVLVLLYNSC
jgi:hypothetical protein